MLDKPPTVTPYGCGLSWSNKKSPMQTTVETCSSVSWKPQGLLIVPFVCYIMKEKRSI